MLLLERNFLDLTNEIKIQRQQKGCHITTVVVILLAKLITVVLRMDRTGNPIARFVYLAHHLKASFKTFEIK